MSQARTSAEPAEQPESTGSADRGAGLPVLQAAGFSAHLDACAWEPPRAEPGQAGDESAAPLGAETFGIELHEQRADAARERLDRVLHTSAFSTRLAHGAFSLLFLNPPYLRSVPSKPAA